MHDRLGKSFKYPRQRDTRNKVSFRLLSMPVEVNRIIPEGEGH